MHRYVVCLWVLATSIATAAPVVVFDSFGPGDSINGPAGITVGCGARCWGDAGHTSAWSFVPAQTVRLSNIQISAWQIFDTPAFIVVGIAGDDLGLPGATLESFSTPLNFGPMAVITFLSVSHPELQAGQRYWLEAGTQDLVNEAADLGTSPTSLSGTEASRIGTGPWSGPYASGMPPSNYAAFRINGETAVPEPYPASLLVLCLCMLIFLRRCPASN
jgi:hypothetical protein